MSKDTTAVLPDNYWKRIVFTFCLGWTVIWIYRAMLSPLYPEIQATIGAQTNSAMGLIASCYFFGYTALQIPSGFLVDRFGQKKVLIPGFTLFALGVLSIGLAKSIMGIYIGAAAAGIGCGTYYGAAFSMTAQHVPAAKKGLSTAIVNSGSAVGMIIGMNASSLLIKYLQLPWQTMAYISSALIFGQVLWFVFALRSSGKPAEHHPVNAAEQAVAEQEPAGMQTQESGRNKPVDDTQGSIFRSSLLACYLLYFTTCYAYYLIVTWLPSFLNTERGISGGMIGLIVSMIAVTAVPGGLFFAHMSDKRRNKKSTIIIFLEISAFVLIAVSMFAPDALSLSIILLLYGFLGKMAVDPVLISHVSDKASKTKLATTLGMFNFFGMSSSVVAPALTGYIIDRTGSGVWGFYLGAVLLLCGTILFAIFNRPPKAAQA